MKRAVWTLAILLVAFGLALGLFIQTTQRAKTRTADLALQMEEGLIPSPMQELAPTTRRVKVLQPSSPESRMIRFHKKRGKRKKIQQQSPIPKRTRVAIKRPVSKGKINGIPTISWNQHRFFNQGEIPPPHYTETYEMLDKHLALIVPKDQNVVLSADEVSKF